MNEEICKLAVIKNWNKKYLETISFIFHLHIIYI
jgi:hypothetical protein